MLPLPSTTSIVVYPCLYLEEGIFPLNILQKPSTSHCAALRSVALTTPIHIHTPGAHMGEICGEVIGQCTNALELVQFLHSLVSQPADLPTTYDLLPHHMKAQVDITFAQRVGCSSTSSDRPDQRPMSALQPRDNIVGLDLLLGNNEVWGFEHVSFEGYSVIHLDRNPSQR